MSMTSFVVGALATHRITRLIERDEITREMREWIFDRYPPGETKIGYLFSCPHCISVWAAGAVTIMELASSTPDSRPSGVFRSTLGVLRHTLALSGAVSLGNEVAGHLSDRL